MAVWIDLIEQEGAHQALSAGVDGLARVFISINHEANDFTVAELTSRVRSVRYPYWMRAGYVEELYFCQRWGEGRSFWAGVASLLGGGR